MGFTHDDKVERSDPAIVKVSSFLIIACGRNSQEKFSFSYYTTCHKRGIRPATGYWCQPAEQREERLFPACHYFRFRSLKCGLGPVPFSVFLWVWLKNIWSVLLYCAQQECNEKRGTPANTFTITPSAKELVKKQERNCSNYSVLSGCFVAHSWLKDPVFTSALFAMSCIPTSCLSFFQGSNFNSFVCVCSVWVLLLHKKRKQNYSISFQCWECSSGAQHGLFFFYFLLSPGTSWRHYMGLMAVIGNMP